jgi:uncharacterized protein YcbK (DUF882 family)
VISGYQSPGLERSRACHDHRVARDSLHVRRIAFDLRIPDCSLADARAAGLDPRAGGVGYSPDSGFVYIDVGRVRVG